MRGGYPVSEEHRQCAATTKAGTHCKNNAMHGSEYCRVHQSWAEKATVRTEKTSDVASVARVEIRNEPPKSTDGVKSEAPSQQANFDILAAELNAWRSRFRQAFRRMCRLSSLLTDLVALVKSNLERFTPDMQVEILSELRRNLEGTSPGDLVDPDTWKGLWYVLNYTVQAQSMSAIESVYTRLADLPGMALLSDLKGNLEGTSPKEFLDPETWKGMWMIMNYTIQATAADLKRKLEGEEDDQVDE